MIVDCKVRFYTLEIRHKRIHSTDIEMYRNAGIETFYCRMEIETDFGEVLKTTEYFIPKEGAWYYLGFGGYTWAYHFTGYNSLYVEDAVYLKTTKINI